MAPQTRRIAFPQVVIERETDAEESSDEDLDDDAAADESEEEGEEVQKIVQVEEEKSVEDPSSSSSKKKLKITKTVCKAFIKMRRHWLADEDLQIEVLSRLPTNDLPPLKCVSREWQHLISDRSFIKVHSMRANEPVTGFFFQERYQWSDIDIGSVSYIPVNMEVDADFHHTVLHFLPKSVVVMASTNGLVCCRSSLPRRPKIYVCNPRNKEWLSLEFPPRDIILGKSVALAFDPLQNPIDVSTDFKLVEISKTLIKTKLETEGENEYRAFLEPMFSFDIYSSKTKAWRRSAEMCKCRHKLVKNKGMFAEGMLFWLTDGNQVLMFDPEKELSLLLDGPLPISYLITIPQMCIGESENKLHYVLVSEHGLQLWVLTDLFISQWELKHSVTFDKLEKENPKLLCNTQKRVEGRVKSSARDTWVDPLGFKDGLVLMRVSTVGFSYHFETRKLRKLVNLSPLGGIQFSATVLPYVMGLVPLGQD